MAQAPSCIRVCGPWRLSIARRPCPCGLYGLRLMHRLNIFLSCSGHSGWAGAFFSLLHGPNPNPKYTCYVRFWCYIFVIIQ
ncbi:hypothetical protein J132_03743 [Termitomyces sp. J132]|nr:hypothetical protein J132_03743 [Termitomyces sp. J132]